jgi:hypothetical protein
MGDGRASGVAFWFPIAWLISPRPLLFPVPGQAWCGTARSTNPFRMVLDLTSLPGSRRLARYAVEPGEGLAAVPVHGDERFQGDRAGVRRVAGNRPAGEVDGLRHVR